MRASEVSPRMFDNDFVDFFSRTHWLAVPAVYVPVVLAGLYLSASSGSSVVAMLVAFAVGIVGWTLTEYWLHRTLFHWEPATWWGPKMHFILHGVHHVHHKDPYRLVMPPAVSLMLAVIFYTLFFTLGVLLTPFIAPGWHYAGFGGFVLGYIGYDCGHYILHHWKPRFTWVKQLRSHHMHHHHNNPDRKFGVSNTLWDHVFGTA